MYALFLVEVTPMKQLITLLAVILILLPFPLQTMNETRIHAEETVIQKIVHNAKEQAKQDGYFTDENIENMKAELVGALPNLEEGDITVDATALADRKERGELIYYKVSVPIENLIAAAKFYGIEDVDNKTTYVIENYTTSEYLP